VCVCACFLFCLRSWPNHEFFDLLWHWNVPSTVVDANQPLSGRRDSFISRHFSLTFNCVLTSIFSNGIYSQLNNSLSLPDPMLVFFLFFCETISFQKVIIMKLRPNRMTDNSLDECYPLSVSYRVEEKRVFFYCMQILVEWNVESKLSRQSLVHTTVGFSFRSCSRRLVFPSFVNQAAVAADLSRCTIAYHPPLRGFFLLLLYSFSLSIYIFLWFTWSYQEDKKPEKPPAFCQSVPLCPSWVSLLSNGNFDPSICRNTARLGEKEKKTAEFCERRHGSNGNKKRMRWPVAPWHMEKGVWQESDREMSLRNWKCIRKIARC
jgi:hypothetical protein